MSACSQLQGFFSAFNAWQERQEQKPLLELQAFCETFNRLALTQSTATPTEHIKMFPVRQYQNFYEDFAPLYKTNIQRGAMINVWQQAGLKQDEVRNTAALAWWLDCNGSHALGNELLTCLIEALTEQVNLPTLNECKNYRVIAEALPLGDIEDRIDIEIQGNDFLIFIEVKINAAEGPEQLQRYHDLLKKKADLYNLKKRALIYLTRYESPKTNVECLCLSWRQLALALERRKLPESVNHTQQLLRQFCQHIQSF